jgi:DNA repair exonuclease SbcCD nuclease subunit
MKLLHFSDLHLDTPFTWAPPAAARKQRLALRDTLTRIIDLALHEHVDAVLCGGDLYEHERFSPDTGDFLRQAFSRLGSIRAFLAPGNHDWLGPTSLYRRVAWPENVHVFGEDRLRPVTLTDGLTLWGGAHRVPANTDDFLHGFAVDRGGIHLALFHGSDRSSLPLQGNGKTPHAAFDPAEIERAGIHHAFLGHYHRPVEAPRHTYPGNPSPLSFGEDGDRGAVIAEVAGDGGVTRVWCPVRTTDAHDLALDVTGCGNASEIRERLASLVSGLSGVARVTLTGTLERQVDLRLDDLESLQDGLVVRVGLLAVAYDLDAIAAEKTVRGQFVRDVRAAEDLDDDERRRILATGLRAFEGRADLEVP